MKKYGVGTFSLIISIFSIMFSFTYLGGEKNIGKYILDAIGISFPTAIISIMLFLISIYIGNKYNEDYGAKLGKSLSIIFIFLIIILSIISSLSS